MSDPQLLTALVGASLGVAFGVAGWWSGFCVRGAIEDSVLRRPSSRLAAYAVALAVALAGVQVLIGLDLLDATKTSHLPNSLSLGGTIVGGVSFGIGMVLSGGCGARMLVLSGGGNLRAVAVLVIFALVAYASMRGIISPLRGWIAGSGALALASPAKEASLAALLAGPPVGVAALRWTAVAIVAALAILAVWHQPSLSGIAGGVLIGIVVAASFAATGWLLVDDFDPRPAEGPSVTRNLGEALVYLLTWTGSKISFSVAWIFGVPVGAALVALMRREAHLEGFSSPRQMLRYATGGALMGIGGVLAAGCTIGHGLSGLALLGPASFVALGAILTGAVATMLWQRRAAARQGGAGVPGAPTSLSTGC